MRPRRSLVQRTLGSRTARLAVAALAFLAVALDSPPTSPSVAGPQPRGGPTADEAQVLDRLALWVLQAQPRDELAQRVRERRRSFELFRDQASGEARRALLEGRPFADLIWRTAGRRGIDPLLLAAVAQAESEFDPEAISEQGAMGLMQIMPETADYYRPDADPLDPAVNLDVGARYLGSLQRQFKGDLTLTLAAYNAGPGNVMRFAGVPPFAETRLYLERVLGRYVEYHQAAWRLAGDLDWLSVEG